MKRLVLLPLVFLSLACCQHEPTPAEQYETALSIWTMEYNHNKAIKATYTPDEPEYQQSHARLVAAADRLRVKRKAFEP